MMNDASTPLARQLCLEPWRVRGAGHAARRLGLSGLVLGVAAYLASAAPACAHDTRPRGAPGTRSAPSPSVPVSIPVLAPLSDPAVLLPIVEQSQGPSHAAASASPSGAASPSTASASHAAAHTGSASPSNIDPLRGAATTLEPGSVPPENVSGSEGAGACERDCSPKRKSQLSLLPEVIVRNINEVPLLAVVMLPVTEGVTITPAEGLPAVTFAVKPTKITRGSGLVAVGTF